VTLRGRLVPVRRLAEILGDCHDMDGRQYCSGGAETLEVDGTGKVPIVVVRVNGQRFGFVVNEVREQQEIVLKPLPEYLARLPGLGSATVMGDGTIVLILDPADIYTAILENAQRGSSASGIATETALANGT
jgi:two-component system, chemotaxis family, sensor kinase CheA